MSTVARGIGKHETVRMVEQAHMDLRRMGIVGPIADRLMMIFIMGACGDDSTKAREAADRLFPVKEVREMATQYPDIFLALNAEFSRDEVKTRPQGGRQLSYITARTAMNRLDNVLGPENCWDEYLPMEHSVLCKLSIRLPDGSVLTKADAGGYAGMSDQGDDDKSGFSDAFKRAAVKFGVGRYLYHDGVPKFKAPASPPAVKPMPSAPAAHHAVNHGNSTGHGSGAYAAPDIVAQYQEWLRSECDEVNQKWLDSLTSKFGDIPASAPAEIISTWQLSGHLLKWGKAKGLVNAPEDVKAGQRDKFAASLMVKADTEVFEEAKDYCRKLWREAKAKVKPPREPGDQPTEAEHEALDRLIDEGKIPA